MERVEESGFPMRKLQFEAKAVHFLQVSRSVQRRHKTACLKQNQLNRVKIWYILKHEATLEIEQSWLLRIDQADSHSIIAI